MIGESEAAYGPVEIVLTEYLQFMCLCVIFVYLALSESYTVLRHPCRLCLDLVEDLHSTVYHVLHSCESVMLHVCIAIVLSCNAML